MPTIFNGSKKKGIIPRFDQIPHNGDMEFLHHHVKHFDAIRNRFDRVLCHIHTYHKMSFFLAHYSKYILIYKQFSAH